MTNLGRCVQTTAVAARDHLGFAFRHTDFVRY